MIQAIELARLNMIEQQVRPWDVTNHRVLETLNNVPREAFAPEDYKDYALMDTEIPLGHGEMMMPPRVEARILQAVNIQAEETVFEVGTGSGYLTACMASLGKHVHSVELHPNLSESAAQKLEAQGITNVTLTQGNAADGWTEAPGTYDIIVVTGSIPTYTDSFEKMLKMGGRLLVITGTAPMMDVNVITKLNDTDYHKEQVFQTQVNALTHLSPTSSFVF